MAKKKEKQQFGCSAHGDSYGATYVGLGSTLEAAYEELKDQLDNAGEDPAAPEACTFWEMQELRVEIDATVKVRKVGFVHG